MASHLIKYAKGLVGQYYQTEGNAKLVVWLGGAPGLPSSATDDARLLSKMGYDLVRPDYYGHARSDGFFSPKSCIQTAYDTIQVFTDRFSLLSIYSDKEIVPPRYEEIIIIGASFGGWIAAMMPKFSPFIKNIVLLYPWLAWDDMGSLGYAEETDEEFLRQYSLQKNLYRIEHGVDPFEALVDIRSVFDLNDMSHLTDVKVFVAHGSADTVIWSGRSEAFMQQLLDFNPVGEYKYVEYYGLGHGDCKEPSLRGWEYRKKLDSTAVGE